MTFLCIYWVACLHVKCLGSSLVGHWSLLSNTSHLAQDSVFATFFTRKITNGWTGRQMSCQSVIHWKMSTLGPAGMCFFSYREFW